MPYNAGDIYVQVVPSFRNTQRLIEAWARNSGIAGMLNEQVNKGLDGAGESARREGAAAGKEFGEEFGKSTEKPLEKSGDQAGSGFARRFKARVEAALKAMPDVKIDADSTDAERAIAEVRARLVSLRDAKVGVDLDAGAAMLELDLIEARMREISGQDLKFDVQIDLGAAMAEIKAFKAWVDGQKAHLDVRVDTHGSATEATNAFRMFNGVLFTSLLLGPALVPALGVATGAMGALGAAAGAAAGSIGVLALSFSGLSKGTAALTKQAEETRAFGEATEATLKAVKLQRADLGAAGWEMALGMSKFREGYLRDLRMMNQAKILPGLREFAKGLSTYGNQLKEFTVAVSAAWSQVLAKMGKWVQGSEMKTFFATMRELTPVFTTKTADILMNVGSAVAGILTAFAPASKSMGDWLLNASKTFAEWGKGLGATEGFKKFVEWMDLNGPKVFGLVGLAVQAVLNILVSIEPYTEPLVALLSSILGWIAGMDPSLLGAITISVIAMTIAFQAAAAAVSVWSGIMTFASGPVGLVILAIVGLAAAFLIFWNNSEAFRTAVTAGWEWLKRAAIDIWGKIHESIAAVVDWAVNTAWPWLKVIIDNLAGAFSWLWDTVLKPVLSSLWDLVKFVGEGLAWLWTNILWPAIQQTGKVLKWLWDSVLFPFFVWLVPILKTVGEAFGWLWTNVIDPAFRGIATVVKWVWENILVPFVTWLTPILKTVGGALGWLWTNVLWPAIQGLGIVLKWVWNSVLVPFFTWLAPIVKRVGEAFGEFWTTTLWPAIQKVGEILKWVWDSILVPFFNWLGPAVQALGDGFVWLWTDVIEPAFRGIAAVVKWAWDNVLFPVITALIDIFNAVATAVTWVVINIVIPIIKLFGAIAVWVFNNVIVPAIEFVKWHFGLLAAVIGWVWGNIIKPVLGFIGANFAWVFRYIVAPAIEFVKWVFGLLGTAIKWVWENVIEPVIGWFKEQWQVLSVVLKSVYDNHIKPVLEGFGSAFEKVKEVIGGVIDWIARNWNTIVGIIKTPIRLVIEVLNNLIGAFNTVANFFGSTPMKTIPLGPFAEDPSFLSTARKSYADGGVIGGQYLGPKRDNVLIRANPREFVQPVAAHDYYGTGVMEAMRRRVIPRELFAGYGVSTPPPRGRWLAEGGVPEPDPGFNIMDVLMGPAAWLKGLVAGLMDNIGSSPFAQMLTALPRKVIEILTDKITNFFSAGNAPISADFGAGAARWAPVALQALALAGQPASLLPLLLHRLMVESGGNPNAINLWDSNAAAGYPSQGLMQTIPQTFYAYAGALASRGITDPLANIYAAIMYTAARYRGDFARAWGGTKGYAAGTSSAEPGWALTGELGPEWVYFRGGEAVLPTGQTPRTSPSVFDAGGWLPTGRSITENWTGKPEAILTADQWAQMQRRTAASELIQIIAQTTSTAEEIAGEVLRAKRRLRVQGRY